MSRLKKPYSLPPGISVYRFPDIAKKPEIMDWQGTHSTVDIFGLARTVIVAWILQASPASSKTYLIARNSASFANRAHQLQRLFTVCWCPLLSVQSFMKSWKAPLKQSYLPMPQQLVPAVVDEYCRFRVTTPAGKLKKHFITLCLLETKLDLLCWGCCKRERLTDRADWVGMGGLFEQRGGGVVLAAWPLEAPRPPPHQTTTGGVGRLYDGKTWSISLFPKSNCKLTKHYVFQLFQIWRPLFFLFLFICLIKAIKKTKKNK